jgi:hypothetical protein
MRAAMHQLRPRTIFTALIVMAVVGAGWHVYRGVREDTFVAGRVTGAALVWRPGMNSSGAEDRTSANAADARRLAHLIHTTHKQPRGPISCPANAGAQVRVTFHREGHADQQVTIALTGCAGPPGRIMSDILRDDLEQLAPPGFWPQRLH